MLDEKKSYKVKGYYNRWSLIDSDGKYGLLENDTWGDETCLLLVKMNAKVINNEIQNIITETFDSIEDTLQDL